MRNRPTKYIVTDGELVLELDVAEEGGYTVTCPFNSGLITEADSLEEAFEMARDAANALEGARKKHSQKKRKRVPRRVAR